MFDTEKSIREWKRELGKLESFEDGTIAELESHLRDEIDRQRLAGFDSEEAFRKAAVLIGRPETIGAKYFKSNAGRLSDAPPWTRSRFSPAVLVWSGLKIALRSVRRQKGYSFINIAGLAVGLSACLLIFLWVKDELSYDRFHDRADAIYRLFIEDRLETRSAFVTATPYPLGEALAREQADIEAIGRIYQSQFQVRSGEHAFNERSVCFTDPGLFEVFSFPAIRGNPVRALSDPGSLVLSEETALKYFGPDDPLGRVVNLDGKFDYTVSAVVRTPMNSDLRFSLYLPMKALARHGLDLASLAENWRARNYGTFIKLRPGITADSFTAKISGFLKTRNPDRNEILRLQPLTRIHLFRPDGTAAGMRSVLIFSIIAVFILLIACVNFMNLATARAQKRAKEVGLRKTVGARRSQLIRQFFAESLFMAFLALGLALLIISAVLPAFSRLTGKPLHLAIADPVVAGGLLLATLAAGLLAGLYPALLLSSFKPVTVLRGRFSSSRRGTAFRKGLIVFQFAISIILIIGAGGISSQLRYLQSRDIGFERDDLVYAYMMGDNRNNVDLLKAELAKSPLFLGATACNNLPTQILYQSSVDWEGRIPGPETNFPYTIGDADYIKTFGMTIVQGRAFSRDNPADEDRFIINEEAARQMGLVSPLGKRLKFMNFRWGEIIGVVRDFNFESMRSPVRPLVLTPKGTKRYFTAKFKPGNAAAAIRDFGRLEPRQSRIRLRRPLRRRIVRSTLPVRKPDGENRRGVCPGGPRLLPRAVRVGLAHGRPENPGDRDPESAGRLRI